MASITLQFTIFYILCRECHSNVHNGYIFLLNKISTNQPHLLVVIACDNYTYCVFLNFNFVQTCKKKKNTVPKDFLEERGTIIHVQKGIYNLSNLPKTRCINFHMKSIGIHSK